MSYLLTRVSEEKSYYFNTDWWPFCLESMHAHGWVPQGTQRYEAHAAAGFMDNVLKDCDYPVSVSDAAGFDLTPEILAQYIAERTGGSYESLLSGFREQWEKGEILIPSTLDRNWKGSYTVNEGQYVTTEDAANMAGALIRAADASDSGSATPELEATKASNGKINLKSFSLMEVGDHEPPHPVADGSAAFRQLAQWMSKGEFRIC